MRTVPHPLNAMQSPNLRLTHSSVHALCPWQQTHFHTWANLFAAGIFLCRGLHFDSSPQETDSVALAVSTVLLCCLQVKGMPASRVQSMGHAVLRLYIPPSWQCIVESCLAATSWSLLDLVQGIQQLSLRAASLLPISDLPLQAKKVGTANSNCASSVPRTGCIGFWRGFTGAIGSIHAAIGSIIRNEVAEFAVLV